MILSPDSFAYMFPAGVPYILSRPFAPPWDKAKNEVAYSASSLPPQVYEFYAALALIEAGWSETHKRIMEDMHLRMIGGHPYVKVALVVKFTQNDRTNMAHECHSHWMREVEFNWREQNLGSQTQVSLLHSAVRYC